MTVSDDMGKGIVVTSFVFVERGWPVVQRRVDVSEAFWNRMCCQEVSRECGQPARSGLTASVEKGPQKKNPNP